MAKGSQVLGTAKSFKRTLDKENDVKWEQPEVEVTADMIVTPQAEVLTEAWYLGARKAVTDAETKDPEEAQKIYENFVLGAEDLRNVRESDVTKETAKMLAAASAEDLRAMGIRYLG